MYNSHDIRKLSVDSRKIPRQTKTNDTHNYVNIIFWQNMIALQ